MNKLVRDKEVDSDVISATGYSQHISIDNKAREVPTSTTMTHHQETLPMADVPTSGDARHNRTGESVNSLYANRNTSAVGERFDDVRLGDSFDSRYESEVITVIAAITTRDTGKPTASDNQTNTSIREPDMVDNVKDIEYSVDSAIISCSPDLDTISLNSIEGALTSIHQRGDSSHNLDTPINARLDDSISSGDIAEYIVDRDDDMPIQVHSRLTSCVGVLLRYVKNITRLLMNLLFPSKVGTTKRGRGIDAHCNPAGDSTNDFHDKQYITNVIKLYLDNLDTERELQESKSEQISELIKCEISKYIENRKGNVKTHANKKRIFTSNIINVFKMCSYIPSMFSFRKDTCKEIIEFDQDTKLNFESIKENNDSHKRRQNIYTYIYIVIIIFILCSPFIPFWTYMKCSLITIYGSNVTSQTLSC